MLTIAPWLYLIAICLNFTSATITGYHAHTGHCKHDDTSVDADYIIVGGGPAGFVLAERLSLDVQTRVVLLEAGPDGTNSDSINIPALDGSNTAPVPNLYVWNFTSQPDPNLGGRTPSLEQGHVWGGGSAINYMQYCRGAPSVFEEWASIAGDAELKWENLVDDFEATSHYATSPSGAFHDADPAVYGHGPLEVSQQPSSDNFDRGFGRAVEEELNLREVDLNAGQNSSLGFTFGMQTIRVSNRTRHYALPAYGWRMVDRPNVRMIHSAMVIKIGFDGKRASNVTYTKANETVTMSAGEIIISAGAIGTPKLLMLSGVGPADHLSELGIPVVADIPDIGANLYDHHFSVVEVEVTNDVWTTYQLLYNVTFAAEAQAQYANNATGFLTIPTGPFAVERIPDSVFDGLHDSYHTSLPRDRGQLLYQYASAAFLSDSPNVSTISAFVALVQPEASGYVRLASNDPHESPLIFSNYYGSKGDKAAILYGYKKMRSVLRNVALAPVVAREVFPGSKVTSDEDIWKAIQKSARTFHHPLGSVALGKVLGSDWRIKGLDGIRVVDSSAIPSPPTCHLQADVYAIAHRAARKIKENDAEASRAWLGR